jgi:hypothetical protein
MSTKASANKTPSIRWSREDFLRRMKDPSLPRPARFEPTRKEPGSYVLGCDGITEVK